MGRLKDATSEKPCARQKVIFELGYF
ncbi:hypothetical protein [Candidatus Nitrosocosmicus arcticus]